MIQLIDIRLILFTMISWLFMQECPPADTVAVDPMQNIYAFTYLNNWDCIEVMTWNIKEFPLNSNTDNYVNEIISDILPDIICIQEIQDESAYNNLKASLPTYSLITTNSGGDTNLSTNLSITIAVIGYSKKKPILRRGAKINDDIYLTNNIGDAFIGLNILKNKIKLSKKNSN